MKKDHVVLAVHILDRVHEANRVQDVFTKFGKSIRTRIGLHDICEQDFVPEGVILLDICGGETAADELKRELTAIEGIETKKLVFTHT